jgi:serine/threonine protein kinase/tetratricopeptide (TPR) repeat protein
MPSGFAATDWEELDNFVEAYETAQAQSEQVDLGEFLPAADHPLYLSVLCELVRVELEYSWQRGRPQSLESYRARFPQLFRHPERVQEIAYEEYRLRRQAGEAVRPAEYQQRYGIPTTGWPDDQAPAAQPTPQADSAGAKPAESENELALAARTYRRLRQQAPADPHPLQDWLAGEAADLPARLFRDLHQASPDAADRLAEAVHHMPQVGSKFLDFHLLEELGRGAFARVYLARQGDLANRLVALKVSAFLWNESQTLAQLQHTHIVPIYSLHRAGPLQAMCMPYLGSTTLADVLRQLAQRPALPASGKELVTTLMARQSATLHPGAAATEANRPAESAPRPLPPPWKELEGRGYVEAVLWLAARLADGLAYAHEHGVVHRDLKPANVLLTDAGQPMLLDFNLSDDASLRGSPAAALMGGTLPYMAPEQLRAFAGRQARPAAGAAELVDARCDIWALGVILAELLTGRHPFPLQRGGVHEVVPQMIADRQQPPTLAGMHPSVTPAVRAMIRRCLEPAPQRRYASARQLAEDLQRHLDNRPLAHTPEPSLRERLRKWVRRHPRLCSTASVAALAATLLIALTTVVLVREQRLAGLEAAESRRQFARDLPGVQFALLNDRSAEHARVAQAAEQCRRLLDRYHVLDDPAWQEQAAVRRLPPEERQRLREEVGELLLLWSRLAQRDAAPRDERTGLQLAMRLNHLAEGCFDDPPAALWRQRLELANLLGQPDDEPARLRVAGTVPPSARNLALLAAAHSSEGRYQQARSLLLQARRLDPQNFWIWFDLGLCQDNLGQTRDAAACYSTCIALAPDFAPLYYKRGLAYLRLKEPREAGADFDQALRLDPDLGAVYVDRALARLELGQHAAALSDLDQALQRGQSPVRVLLLRSRVHNLAGNREAAVRDRAQGLHLIPTDEAGWLARGFAHLADDPAAALQDFDAALKLNPASLAALQNKAHVLAETLGQSQKAIQVLDQAVRLYPDHAPAWAGRGVLHARLGQRDAALRDAREGLARDTEPATLFQVGCIYALTAREQPEDLLEARRLVLSALRRGYGWDLVERDPDLERLRQDADFRQLLEGLRPPAGGARKAPG